MGIQRFIGLSVISAVVVTSAFAQNSGLVSIPVADTIGFKEFELGHAIGGVENSKHYSHGGYLLFGAYDRIELALGTDYQSSNAWGIKAKVWQSKDDTWAIGVGTQNIVGNHNEPFAMLRHTIGTCNLHCGWFNNDRDRAAFGVDTALGDKLVLGLDHSTAAAAERSAARAQNLVASSDSLSETIASVDQSATKAAELSSQTDESLRFANDALEQIST